MPTYCIRTDEGALEEIILPAKEAPRLGVKYELADGRWGYRDMAAEQNGIKTKTHLWPMRSVAMGVAASQVKEAQTDADAHGIDVHYEKDGDMTIPNKTEWRKILRHTGMYDRTGWVSPVHK